MQRLKLLSLPLVATVLVPAAFLNAQTFTFSDDFNTYATGVKPEGWNTLNNHNPARADLDPSGQTADPASWGTQCGAGGIGDPPGCSTLGATAIQNYLIPWSGGGRLNLIHPANSPGDGSGWAGAAWYKGTNSTRHTGTYPIPLGSNRLKLTFDMLVRTGDTRCTVPADGCAVAIVPVTNLDNDTNVIGGAGGGNGVLGLGGFNIEFDFYDNAEPTDPAGADAANHLGLNVNLFGVDSIVTNVDLVGAGSIPRFLTVSDNNQPIHVSIFYNDDRLPGGGVGIVQVYLKVDPATYDGSFGGTMAGALEYGTTAGNADPDNASELGFLVLQACVGPWPESAPTGIFGFTGSIGGCNSVVQVDNVAAEAFAISGDACVPTGIPGFDPGSQVDLDPAGAEADSNGLSMPGWNVATYPVWSGDLGTDAGGTGLKGSLAYDVANGLIYASVSGEPDLNYSDDAPLANSCNVPGDRWFPGLAGGSHDSIGAVATGWITFPPDDGSKPYPRSYPLNLTSDDGFEVLFGTGKTNQVAKSFTTGRGCGGSADPASIFNLVVPEAGTYAIQILWFEGGGGANLEFFRRFASENLLLVPPVKLVGADQGPFTDQPIVHSLKNGQPPPNLLATYTPVTLTTVDLDPSQRIDGTGTGASGFNIKSVRPNYQGQGMPNIGLARDDDGRQTARGFMDALANQVPGMVSATVNFRDPGQNQGAVPDNCSAAGNSDCFPGHTGAIDNFALVATGFATFATPGLYFLGLDTDDDGYLYIGQQSVFTTGCCPNQMITLNVTQAGTYPIKVAFTENGGDARVKFYERAIVFNGGQVPVNGAGSTVTVNVAATTGDYAWPNKSSWAIPADRKVAEVGQGTTLGWNATLSQLPGVDLNADGNYDTQIANNPTRGGLGLAIALTENSLAGFGEGLATQAFDTPMAINYDDIGEDNANFTAASTIAGQAVAGRDTSNFLKADTTPIFTAGGNDHFTISASGYIEFTQPGYYAFGTNGDDGMIMWVGGVVVTVFPFNTGPTDNTPAFVLISEPGIYDVRVDSFEVGGGYAMEMFQYLPDGTTRALVNSDAATVKVYRELSVTPENTNYHNPVQLPLSAKVADIDRGGDPGARIQLANVTFLTGNGDGGLNHDMFRTFQEAHELFEEVFDGVPSLAQSGTLVYDGNIPGDPKAINFGDLAGEVAFPGPVNADDFGMRASGVLALTQGGHIFEVASDDGFTLTIGDLMVGRSGALKGGSFVRCYVNAPEDGLYPFVLEWLERGGGNNVTFREVRGVAGPALVSELVNTGDAAKMYVSANPCAIPFADLDGDGDVDGTDFGILQACYTGDGTFVLASACGCGDTDNNDNINSADLAAFTNCVSGPDIPWTQAGSPNCNP